MKNIQSHFSFNKKQRNGIFFLLLIIVVLQIVIFYVDFSSEVKIQVSQNEIIAFEHEMDSLRLIEIENSKPKIYPFNPNYISDFKGYQLGMSVQEIDKLIKYRAKGLYVNSVQQFQEVTGVSDRLLIKISPYFKFPAWVTSKKTQNTKPIISKEAIVEVKDINLATVEELQVVKGIGEKLAHRITNYRSKLQGYSYNSQLFEVWNLDAEVVKQLLMHFQVKEQPVIQKINVNTATFKEVLAIVYIDYELTKKIFNYKDEVAEIQSIEELKKIDGFPLVQFDRIALYLTAE
ncbi:DNA uptake protein ComE [Lutibacter agarilyticus]|uniref:DNA uptake protein ComE n=1 Tax=Lutibacter agarilyticus TaxID=1109740 RepID=A0A238Y179_9FLAO|nr:helix-hairpin-helix domain-containing protein [Lutibacter agarilyticus]SNR64364.1 DNA uptake protein ComE [Lutibacter agarilyticus]